MSIASKSPQLIADEAAEATLAKNLVVARVVAGLTQRELADASGISRATVAQIETGCSDPRLSTIVDLAKAMGIPPILLLAGAFDINALVQLAHDDEVSDTTIGNNDVASMRYYLKTGMLRDRLRAALLGAGVIASAGASHSGQVAAAIFSAVLPGIGTLVGGRLGDLLNAVRASGEKSADATDPHLHE